MDQLLISVCCSPQNEHIDIKKVADGYVRVILIGCRKCPKIHVLYLLRHLFCPGNFSGTTTVTGIVDTPLEPLWPVDLTFGSFFNIMSHLEGWIPKKRPKRGVNRHFQLSSQYGKTLKLVYYRTAIPSLTKFCTTINTTRYSLCVI